MTGSSLDWDRIGRYLAGESSPDEAAAVRRWLQENPADARAIAALDDALKGVPPAPVDVEAALRQVKTRMHAAAPTPWRRPVALVAAAAILLVAGVLVARRRPAVRPTAAALTYATAVGVRREVLLPDGTQVMLGPATTLVVRGRVAELTGQAFFSVAHDPARPFTVRAGDAVIRDIGTDFTVHNDSGEAVRVVVSEGIVQLNHARDSVVLVRGDVGTLEPDGRMAAARGAATDDDMAWTLGRLVFRDASVAELTADLRRWYGVELRVTDSTLLSRHFTGSFGKEPANRVLDVIALALGARVDLRGDTAYIRTAPPSR
jgi:transmembrane sensor